MNVIHGGFDYAELARLDRRPSDLLDFSSNVNPYGPPPGVREVLATLDLASYPDRECTELRQMLARMHACPADAVLVGNGSAELIDLVARAMLRPGDCALMIGPTFGEYARASRLAGASVLQWAACAADGFAVDWPAVSMEIEHARPRVVWLCEPNNPTGTRIADGDLVRLVATCQAANVLLVVDRAYAHVVPTSAEFDAALRASCVIQLWSLTKAYGLAGLRLGYLLAAPWLVAEIAAYQPAWSINSAAQVAGRVSLGEPQWLAHTLQQLWDDSRWLRSALTEINLRVLPSALPFFLVEVASATATRSELLRLGCLVRDCSSFGLPGYLRIAPRRLPDNRRLVAAWRTL